MTYKQNWGLLLASKVLEDRLVVLYNNYQKMWI